MNLTDKIKRGLNQAQVKKVLQNPDIVLSSYGNRVIAEKDFGKLNLRVIYIEENSDRIIVTAHWADKR